MLAITITVQLNRAITKPRNSPPLRTLFNAYAAPRHVFSPQKNIRAPLNLLFESRFSGVYCDAIPNVLVG